MRKINLIILLATVLIATSLRASGNGSGSPKANSIEFDWTTGVVHSGDKLWYRIDLGSLPTYSQPFFLIHFCNPSLSDTVHFRCETAVLGTAFNFDEDVAPGQEVTSAESSLGSLIAKQESPELFFKMESSGAIHIMCTVIEESYPPSLCDEWNVLEKIHYPQDHMYETYKYRMTTDTVINAMRYVKIEKNHQYQGALREDNNANIYVVYPDYQQECLLYAFNAQIGDTLKNTCMGDLTVIDIRPTTPRTFILDAEYEIYDDEEVEHTGHWDFEWIEGIGYSMGNPVRYGGFLPGSIHELDSDVIMLCAYKNGEQVFKSEHADYFGCEYYLHDDHLTDIPMTVPDTLSSATKILRDGQLYILREGKTYTVTGQEVK